MAKKRIERKKASRGSFVALKNLDQKVQATVNYSARSEALPQFKAGDTLRVHVRIKEGDKERVQAYEGLCIALGNHGGGRSFNVRKISHGVGVERIFLMNSPKIAKIDVIQEGKVRRAKLYYIRELEGKAAKIDREVETQASAAQKAARKETAKSEKAKA